jgi:hypothetical protein
LFSWQTFTTNQIFQALGNERPQILVRLENYVLDAIVAISEGKSRENVMHDLYSQILPLENDLRNESSAMAWFDFSTAFVPVSSTPELSEYPSTPSAGWSI